MIYLDNGATTYPKPVSVIKNVNYALNNSANPGRGGHNLAMKASEIVYNCRANIAELFNAKDPSNVVFTLNCTEALNIVIKGVLKSGDHVIISSLEHNAVLRPTEKLKKRGISYSIANVVEGDNEATLNNFRDVIRENTRLVVCTCASNVTGYIPPYERIFALCHQYGILTCADCAQVAGVLPIDLSDSSVDYLCAAGHKSLYGPMGTGVLIINCDTIPNSLFEGGTGSNSSDYNQPDVIPDRFESGTCNLVGIAGLNGGINFLKGKGITNIYKNEFKLIKYAYTELSNIKKVRLYTKEPELNRYAPVLSFNIEGENCETVSQKLNNRFNIATRAGLHCAPLAHKSINTLDIGGTVRIVPSAFSTKNDISAFINAVYKIK